MATPAPELYDRKVIMEVIERDCLGDPGSSGVIVGSQKVGKTHLLNHVSKICNKGKDTVFCRLNIDNLEAAGFSDDSFLRLFLSELQETVTGNIRDLQTQESTWQDDLAKLQSVVEIAPGQREAIRASLDELIALREIDALIQKLLERTEPLEPAKTFQVFNGFRRIRKRVVLVIDEFHRMMRETGFTNRLFAFLRGASMQGKILTLVSSPVHLMDPSLHGPEAEGRYDRLNLFNHYQMQFLEPFTQEEAEGFLDWLPPLQPPLKAEDKRYIYRLGGGSPYFLRKARDLFGKFRPQTDDKRREFESKWIAGDFEPDLSLLWKRCLPEERTVLSDVAINGKSDSPLRAKLEREGYVVQADTGLQLFSTAFSEFVRRQPVQAPSKPIESKPTATTGVTIGTVELISKNLISALGLARTEQGPIFKFEVTNTNQAEVVVRVACSVVDYSQATIRTYRVTPGKTTLNGYAVLRDEDLHKIQNARATNVNYRISYGPVDAERVLDDGQLELTVLPPNNFLITVFDPATDRLIDFTWLISVWVRKRGSELQKLLNEASKECQLDGYQAPAGADVREHTRKQVSALYNAVRNRGLQFQNNAQVYLNAPERYIQEVRFAEQSLQDNSANCLDFAVLFASLLLVCRIDPLILFVPGHAIVGWKDGADGMEFLQTTGIAANAFGAAWEIGMQIYKDRKAKCDAYVALKPDFIEDPHEFAILVDIVEVCRTKQLTKI